MDRQQTLLTTAVNASAFGIVITDPSQAGNPIVFANRAFSQTTGYSEAECIGRNCRFLQGPGTDRGAIRQLSEGVRARRPIRVVLRNYRKDGSPFWNDVAISPVFDDAGALLAYISVQHDVTDHIAAEEAVRTSEARLRDFVDLSAGWFWERGADLRFTYVSPALAEACGHPGPAFIGRMEPEIDAQAFPDWAQLESHLREGRQPIRDFAFRIRAVDGRVHEARLDARPVYRDDGKLGGFRGWLAPSGVAPPDQPQRTASDLDMTSLSSRDMAVIGRLGAGIAHDINNLLTILHGNLQLLSLEEAVQAVPDVEDLIDCALSASREGACLARTLSMFGAHHRLSLAPVDVNALLTDLLGTIRLTLSTAVAIDLDLDPLAPRAVTDAAHLEAAIINLVNNARDAMPDGGHLTITTWLGNSPAGSGGVQTGRRQPDRPQGDCYVGIAVTDTGIGMTKDVLQRATTPLFTLKAEGKGAGLGLAMVDRFATASNGRLALDSAPDRGTTATLLLPAAPPA
ncbi:MAG: PAS domain S-box protein [Rhodospirillaceae bacterium]|nr:PAS domain S-box protein [Rhodospirillaceae bacterium]